MPPEMLRISHTKEPKQSLASPVQGEVARHRRDGGVVGEAISPDYRRHLPLHKGSFSSSLPSAGVAAQLLGRWCGTAAPEGL